MNTSATVAPRHGCFLRTAALCLSALALACGPSAGESGSGDPSTGDSPTSGPTATSSATLSSSSTAGSKSDTTSAGSASDGTTSGVAICDPQPRGETFCSTPVSLGTWFRYYVLEGTDPEPPPSCGSTGVWGPCGGDLEGTTWELVDVCERPEAGIPNEWDCGSDRYRTERYEESGTVTFEDGLVTNRFTYTRDSYFLTTAESCGVDSCDEVEVCASLDQDATTECTIANAGGCRCYTTRQASDVELSAAYTVEGMAHLLGAGEAFLPEGPVRYCRLGDVLQVWIEIYQYPETTDRPCPEDGSPCPANTAYPQELPGICVSI